MSTGLEYEDLGPAESADGGAPAARGAGDLRRLSAVPVDLTVEVGRTRMTVGETLELRQGSIITLNRMAGEPVDLLVNGTPIARGEVVVIDEQFGLRVTEVLGGSTPGEAPRPTGIEHPDELAVAGQSPGGD
jgi:flagellar motor switch protein FliN/FliY